MAQKQGRPSIPLPEHGNKPDKTAMLTCTFCLTTRARMKVFLSRRPARTRLIAGAHFSLNAAPANKIYPLSSAPSPKHTDHIPTVSTALVTKRGESVGKKWAEALGVQPRVEVGMAWSLSNHSVLTREAHT
jgi:hypothetical protein